MRGDGGELSAAAMNSLNAGRAVKTSGFTVATLPTGAAGDRAYVTDANAAFTAGIGAVVAGGGANVVPVFYDGTDWRIG